MDRVSQDDYWAQQRYDDAVFAHEQVSHEHEVIHNVFDEGVEYKNLADEIEIRSFDYAGDISKQERAYLQPQLEYLGYTDIQWMAGETDSFGPLTRVCKATDHFGKTVWFVYG